MSAATTIDDARERLIRAASDLMYEGGYAAVGVADICRVADTRKGSFYHYFDSKAALAIETLERSWAWTQRVIFAPAFGEDPSLGVDGRGTIEAFTLYGEHLAANLRRQLDERDLVSGCRFGNFAAELSTRDDEIRAAVDAIFDAMTAVFAAAIRRGQTIGDVPSSIDPDAAARMILAQMEGLMLLAKSARDPDLLAQLRPCVTALLS